MICACGEPKPGVFDVDGDVIVRHRIGYVMVAGTSVPKWCDGMEY